MLSKLAVLIILGLALFTGEPMNATPETAALAQKTPVARLSLCLGPVMMGFATPGGAPLTLMFNTSGHCNGFAGLVQIGAGQPEKPFRNRLSGDEFEQKLPTLVPPRR